MRMVYRVDINKQKLNAQSQNMIIPISKKIYNFYMDISSSDDPLGRLKYGACTLVTNNMVNRKIKSVEDES